LFPRGLDALTEYLEVCTLAAIIQSISKKRRSMHSSVGFKQTFEAGVEGVVEAFRQAPWTREVLRWNRGLLASYLLNTDPDGLWAVLSSYTAACARSFRCLTDNVDEHAKTLVWEVLSTWLVKYPPPEDRRLAWPHIEHVRAVIMEPLERFIAVVRPSNEEQDSAAVPDVAVPSALEPSQAAF
jgi:hypothetical protein